ncbi:MAG: hypothetical protein ABW137_32480 [Mycobacterium sp.]
MNKYFFGALAAGAMTAATLGFAGAANAESTGPTYVQDTVRTLEAGGYNVILNRTGAAPLSACTITSVQTGPTFSTVDSRGGGSPAETVLAKTVHIDLAC